MTNLLNLPFPKILALDTEFYHGRGRANGGSDGDAVTPLSYVAKELRSGEMWSGWQGEFGPQPPYPIGEDTLVLTYGGAAEGGFHLALGWPAAANPVDMFIECRHHFNNGAAKAEDRKKGFFKFANMLLAFGCDGLDAAHKHDMHDRILEGPPFSASERATILDYNTEDTLGLERLAHRVAPTIQNLKQAEFRARFSWALAPVERRGIPVDMSSYVPMRGRWDDLRLGVVRERDPHHLYEIGADGKPHWRDQRWADFIEARGWDMPKNQNGAYSVDDKVLKSMCGRYPEVVQIRELRNTLSKLRLNKLAIGNDGRNRTPFWGYSTKTGRCAPSNSECIFGLAKFLRFLISPPPGRALVHRDYRGQEMLVAAIRSGDRELLRACEAGDIYLNIAAQLGMAPADATAETHGPVRDMFKIVCLASVLYGGGAKSLALRTGVAEHEASEILARLKARFWRFEEYAAATLDRAGLDMELRTPFGWRMQCPPDINPRTLRNYPIQSCASEILHVAILLAERRDLQIVAPVHDALMCECAVEDIEATSAELDRVMRDAARVVLGYPLPTDEQIIRPGERYYDKRGAPMWATIQQLLTQLEAKCA